MDAFDSSFLTFLFVPNAPCSVDRAKDRIEDLIGRIHGGGDQIVIPTPALSELLVAIGHSRSAVLNHLTKTPKFILAPFDTRAAFELALIADSIRKKSGKKKGDAGGTWAKVKFDWQIVAIAKVNNVSTIYSEDLDIHKLATGQNIVAKNVASLPLPTKGFEGPTLFEK